MNDILPDNRNRVANLISHIFHPAVVGIPTLLAILSEMSLSESIGWMGLMLGVLLVPNIVLQVILQRRGRFVYQRQTRLPMYVVGWFLVVGSTAYKPSEQVSSSPALLWYIGLGVLALVMCTTLLLYGLTLYSGTDITAG